jgi:hypothetical protein
MQGYRCASCRLPERMCPEHIVWPAAARAAADLLRALMVRKGGLEPPRLAALVPKTRASTNSATFAWGHCATQGKRLVGQRPGAGVRTQAAITSLMRHP